MFGKEIEAFFSRLSWVNVLGARELRPDRRGRSNVYAF